MQETISLPELTCQRCGYKWNPRKNELPTVCPNPKCHSPWWNKPRKNDNNHEDSHIIPVNGGDNDSSEAR